MEGPQSDKDQLLYEQMTARLGDISVPTGDRKAALQQLRMLQEKYINNQPGPLPVPTTQITPLDGATIQSLVDKYAPG
jgi:hypothetical protein